MKRVFYSILATAVLAVMVAACGGGSGNAVLRGTYEAEDNGEGFKVAIIFSGKDKFKITANGETMAEGTYEVVVEYKENNFSRGYVKFKTRDEDQQERYELEGNKLKILGQVLTKK